MLDANVTKLRDSVADHFRISGGVVPRSNSRASC
jgi:hypothetical protein